MSPASYASRRRVLNWIQSQPGVTIAAANLDRKQLRAAQHKQLHFDPCRACRPQLAIEVLQRAHAVSAVRAVIGTLSAYADDSGKYVADSSLVVSGEACLARGSQDKHDEGGQPPFFRGHRRVSSRVSTASTVYQSRQADRKRPRIMLCYAFGRIVDNALVNGFGASEGFAAAD